MNYDYRKLTDEEQNTFSWMLQNKKIISILSKKMDLPYFDIRCKLKGVSGVNDYQLAIIKEINEKGLYRRLGIHENKS